MPSPIRAAIVGCGNIANRYAKQAKDYPAAVELAGFFDLDASRAQAFAEEFGGTAYPSLEALLADDAVDLVVNLTIHHVHFKTTTQMLEAGKHVYSEKPLALSADEAMKLVALAEAKGVTLAGAPMNFLGDAQQKTWKLIRDGAIGTPRLVYAEVNHGRIETWHPNPEPFYDVGPLWDVGVYPLTLATTFFGPVTRVVAAHQTVVYPNRTTKEGRDFTIEAPELTIAVLEIGEIVVRLTTNFFVHSKNSHQGPRFEVHGETGSVVLGNFQNNDALVEHSAFNEDLAGEPWPEGTPGPQQFGRGLNEVCVALQEGRRPRVTGKQAAHVVEVLDTIAAVAKSHTPTAIKSTFDAVEPSL
ncbi:MAG: Gfo/Idh/MocA family oxidoreductase [Planctomycetota bacterium]